MTQCHRVTSIAGKFIKQISANLSAQCLYMHKSNDVCWPAGLQAHRRMLVIADLRPSSLTSAKVAHAALQADFRCYSQSDNQHAKSKVI